MWAALKRDPRFIFFVSGAALALIISAPFTYAIVSPFHQAGEIWSGVWWYGAIISAMLVVLLEAGAIGAKLAGINWLCKVLLGLTGIGNLVTGSDYWSRADLVNSPMLQAWRDSWLGWLPPLLYAGTVPVLLYLFVDHALKRAGELGDQRSPAQELAEQVADRLIAILPAAQPLALPAQPIYDAPREQRTAAVATLNFVCDVCSQEASAMQRRTANQHGAWVCKGCGKRCAAQG